MVRKCIEKTLDGGWMGGWVEAKAGLSIAYSNQKWHLMLIWPPCGMPFADWPLTG